MFTCLPTVTAQISLVVSPEISWRKTNAAQEYSKSKKELCVHTRDESIMTLFVHRQTYKYVQQTGKLHNGIDLTKDNKNYTLFYNTKYLNTYDYDSRIEIYVNQLKI